VDVSRATDNCVGVLDDGVGFIQKPFSKDDLARCVCDALDDKGRGG
jgi:FixJ family two-component response regulator